MNKYVKSFLHRGAIFGGFGPMVMGIIYLIIEFTTDNFSINGKDIFLGIITTYFIAFLHAGASVFNQIESWSVPKSMLFNFLTIYVAYTLGYILNSWIPFNIKILLIYTGIFIIAYLIIWLIAFFSIRFTTKKLNSKL